MQQEETPPPPGKGERKGNKKVLSTQRFKEWLKADRRRNRSQETKGLEQRILIFFTTEHRLLRR